MKKNCKRNCDHCLQSLCKFSTPRTDVCMKDTEDKVAKLKFGYVVHYKIVGMLWLFLVLLGLAVLEEVDATLLGLISPPPLPDTDDAVPPRTVDAVDNLSSSVSMFDDEDEIITGGNDVASMEEAVLTKNNVSVLGGESRPTGAMICCS